MVPMNKLLISPEAREDLEGIKAYIHDELENPTAAINVISRITKSLKKLKDMPGIGPCLSLKVPFETGYRFLVCGNYLAFYRYEDKTVFVDRILYGRRDYVKILFPKIEQEQGDTVL
jgi:addiction module RelE/StbE family toxin